MQKRISKKLPFIEDERQLPATVTTFIAAAFLHSNQADISRRCNRGDIKAARVGSGWLIPKQNLVAYSRGLPQPIQVGSEVTQ